MITRQMSLEYGLAHQIAKNGFGEHIIVGTTTRMACTPSVRSSYIRIDFSDLTNLEIFQQSDWSYMTLRMRRESDSIFRDMTYVSERNCLVSPELVTKPEECYQDLKRLVMSMFDDVAGGN